ncbi:hypothetical protein [Streptomyces sp. NPDC048643]
MAIKWGQPSGTILGTVKLPSGTPVPTDLLRRMIAYRIREHEEDGVRWM